MKQNAIILHEKTFDIAWGDMDALGHVNNGKYFDYFQEARIEWLQALNFDMKQEQGPVVVHVACSFLKPVVYPATLTIRSSLHDIGRSSLTMAHNLYQGENLVAEGISKVVWVDYQANQSVPLPDEIRNALKPR